MKRIIMLSFVWISHSFASSDFVERLDQLSARGQIEYDSPRAESMYNLEKRRRVPISEKKEKFEKAALLYCEGVLDAAAISDRASIDELGPLLNMNYANNYMADLLRVRLYILQGCEKEDKLEQALIGLGEKEGQSRHFMDFVLLYGSINLAHEKGRFPDNVVDAVESFLLKHREVWENSVEQNGKRTTIKF